MSSPRQRGDHQLPDTFAKILRVLYTTRDPRLLATIKAAQASGWTNGAIGHACGVSTSRISQLRNLPTLGYGPVPNIPVVPGVTPPELPEPDGGGRPLLMDLDTAATELTLSPVTVRKYIDRGKLAGFKDGGTWYVLRPATGPQTPPAPDPASPTNLYRTTLEQVRDRTVELLQTMPTDAQEQSKAALDLVRLATELWYSAADPGPRQRPAELPGDTYFRTAIEARLETSPDPIEAASLKADHDELDKLMMSPGPQAPYWTLAVEWVRLRRAFKARHGVALRAWDTGRGVHIGTDIDFRVRLSDRTLSRRAGDMLDETESNRRKNRARFKAADERLPDCHQCLTVARGALPDFDLTLPFEQLVESGWDWDSEG